MTTEGVHKNRFLTPSRPLEPAGLSAWELTQVRICSCVKCPRLVDWRQKVSAARLASHAPQYEWNRPVPGFGDPFARLLVVGLAPTINGSNRTGRLFTGDGAGEYLFSAMYRAGFANRPHSTSFSDQIEVSDAYVTSICRCVAPQNRPYLSEIDTCQVFLEAEIRLLGQLKGVMALGHFAFDRMLTIYRQQGVDIPALKFKHGAVFQPTPALPWILCSYHPSDQNTQTGRLQQNGFDTVWQLARRLLDSPTDPE